MYLLSRLLYATIVLFTGGGMAVGALAKALRWGDTRAMEKSWKKRLLNASGILWAVVAVLAAVTALYGYSTLVPEHHLKIVGLFPVAVAVLTLYKVTDRA